MIQAVELKVPEIYSVDGQGGRGRFVCFCFPSAPFADLLEDVPDRSEGIATEGERKLPCWHVPVPAVSGENVARFAAEGFATVVCLPLKSAAEMDASAEPVLGQGQYLVPSGWEREGCLCI